MDNEQLVELDDSYLSQMEELYKEAFGGAPWNDDWSDGVQLNEYMRDISGAEGKSKNGSCRHGERQ